MGAIWMRVRADLRGGWVGIVGFALLIGIVGGGVTAIAAGARRTDSAYPRLAEGTRSPTLMVDLQPRDDSFARFSAGDVSKLSEVSQAEQFDSYTALRPYLNLISPRSDAWGSTVWTRKMLSGREPVPTRPDEVTISFSAQQRFGINLGDRLHLDMQPAAEGVPPVPVDVKVVGVDAAVGEFTPSSSNDSLLAWTTPAFARVHGAALADEPGTVIWLHHGDGDLARFGAGLARLSNGKLNQAFPFSAEGRQTQRSIHLQAVALWMLAGLLAVAAVLVVAQLLARQHDLDAVGYRELRVAGMTRRQVWGVGMVRTAVLGVVAAAVAAVVAYAASPIFPVGLAGIAEPAPGLRLDRVAIGLGALATLLAVVLLGAWPAWRTARESGRASATSRSRRSTRVPSALGRPGSVPVTAAVGMTFALESGRGRSSVPVRSTLAAATIGLAALTAAVVFSASLTHLVATPTLYGVTMDAIMSTNTTDGSSVAPAAASLRQDRALSAVSQGYTAIPAKVNGVSADAMAVESVKGAPLQPVVTAGRLPVADDEVLMGADSLRRVGAHIGDRVHIVLAGRTAKQPFRVVGTGVFPALGDSIDLGQGAALTIGALHAIAGAELPPPDTMLVRGTAGLDHDAVVARVEADIHDRTGTVQVAAPGEPTDLVNFGRVNQLPLLFGSLLAALALGTLAHLLVTSIRRRRIDLALLKTLGFVPGQLRRTVAWQATTIATLAVVVGVPIGVIVGRWIWIAVAHQLGVVPVPVVAPAMIAAIVVGAVVVANLIAVVPARWAARTRPAAVLRAG